MLPTQPNKSVLVVTGKDENDVEPTGPDKKKSKRNQWQDIAFFDRIDYYLGGNKIDSIRKHGISTTMKGLITIENYLK